MKEFNFVMSTFYGHESPLNIIGKIVLLPLILWMALILGLMDTLFFKGDS